MILKQSLSKVVIFTCFLFSHSLFSQNAQLLSTDGWELKKEKDDIKVFSKSIDGFKIKAFKAVGFIDASPEIIFNVLVDVEKYPEWYPDCKSGTLLKSIDDKSHYQRIEYKLPWPFDPRDAVNKIESTNNQGAILIKILNASDYIKEQEDAVRIPLSEGYWLLEPSEGGTELTYSAIAEAPGVPAWIVNLFVFDGPIGAIENLREMVKKPEYSTKSIWNK